MPFRSSLLSAATAATLGVASVAAVAQDVPSSPQRPMTAAALSPSPAGTDGQLESTVRRTAPGSIPGPLLNVRSDSGRLVVEVPSRILGLDFIVHVSLHERIGGGSLWKDLPDLKLRGSIFRWARA